MKILLAYDVFERSRRALEETAGLAAGAEAEITVFSVVPPDARASKSGGHVGMRPHAQEDVATGHAYLRERGIASEMKVAHGDPAEEIVAEAKKGAYDVIVVGSRGLGPLGQLLFGSVSARVVKTAPCPVLVAGQDLAERVEPTASPAT